MSAKDSRRVITFLPPPLKASDIRARASYPSPRSSDLGTSNDTAELLRSPTVQDSPAPVLNSYQPPSPPPSDPIPAEIMDQAVNVDWSDVQERYTAVREHMRNVSIAVLFDM